MPGKHVHFSSEVSKIPPTPSPSYSSTSLPSSYGPVTPPPNQYIPSQLYSPDASAAQINPVLDLSNTGYPHLLFDVSLPVANVRPSNPSLPPNTLGEYATSPPLPSLIITHPQLMSSKIIVTPATGRYVLVSDVLQKIYSYLRSDENVASDYNVLPPDMQGRVQAAYMSRYRRIPDASSRQLEKSKLLKRVDFLTGFTKFMGLSKTVKGSNVWQLNVS